jgi:ADP-heptose:LPS heptosyltransferase
MVIPDAVKKIAVLRANALGDFIVTLPAFQALRETFTNAEIILLGKDWHKSFLEKRPGPIDRVIVIPENHSDIFFETMHEEHFDIAIHFQGEGNISNPFINKLGATLTVGMRNEGAEKINFSIPYIHYQSEVSRYLEIVSLIGARTKIVEPILEVTHDKDEALKVAPHIKGKEFIVLHAGADDIRRRWPEENFIQLGRFLEKEGYDLVLTGTRKEAELVGRICSKLTKATNMCDKLSISGLAGLLAMSKLTVSSDTGPLHLARAVGTKTVGIYWAPNLLNWGPITRKKHRVAIAWNVPCPLCGIMPVTPWPFEPHTSTCKHEISFVNDVKVDEVLSNVLDLLK